MDNIGAWGKKKCMELIKNHKQTLSHREVLCHLTVVKPTDLWNRLLCEPGEPRWRSLLQSLSWKTFLTGPRIPAAGAQTGKEQSSQAAFVTRNVSNSHHRHSWDLPDERVALTELKAADESVRPRELMQFFFFKGYHSRRECSAQQ